MFRFILEIGIIFLLIVWFMGVFISPVGSNFIHVLLVVIGLGVAIRLTQGRSPA